MKQLTISTVTYENDLDKLIELFNSLLAVDLNKTIFVIDNSDTDTIRKLCEGKEINYIFNDKNLGYGAGHNVAIRQIIDLSEYHLAMNPDINFEKGTLEDIYNFITRYPDIGLVMPKVLSADGSIDYSCKLLPKPYNLFFRRFGSRIDMFKSLVEKTNNVYELRFTGYNKIMEVPCLSGCFMFIKNEVFKKVGLFDERFFMYLEDFDLSRRIQKYYRNIYYPEAVICHENSRGSYEKAKLLKCHVLSAIRYFNKWGWFIDKERSSRNKQILEKINVNE